MIAFTVGRVSGHIRYTSAPSAAASRASSDSPPK
jgi:hypothetical protein